MIVSFWSGWSCLIVLIFNFIKILKVLCFNSTPIQIILSQIVNYAILLYSAQIFLRVCKSYLNNGNFWSLGLHFNFNYSKIQFGKLWISRFPLTLWWNTTCKFKILFIFIDTHFLICILKSPAYLALPVLFCFFFKPGKNML